MLITSMVQRVPTVVTKQHRAGPAPAIGPAARARWGDHLRRVGAEAVDVVEDEAQKLEDLVVEALKAGPGAAGAQGGLRSRWLGWWLVTGS